MLKKITKLFIVLIFFSGMIYSKDLINVYYKKGDILNVLTPSGMNLREEASVNSKAILMLPYASQVIVEELTNKSYESENIKGYFVKVKYNGKTGYLFDGFLSKLTAPDLKKNLFIDSYAAQYFKKSKDFTDKKGALNITGIKYSNGAVYKHSRYEGGSSHELSIPNIRASEGFLLLKSLGILDPKDVFPVKNSEYKTKGKSNLTGQTVNIDVKVTIQEEKGVKYYLYEKYFSDGDTTGCSIQQEGNIITISWSRAD